MKLPVDIVFVLDATKSTQPVFSSMVDQVNDLAIDLSFNFPKASLYFGAVIYRDPVDYKEMKGGKIDPEIQRQIDEINAKAKIERDKKLREHDIDPVELDEQIAERESHFDTKQYPFDKNVAIDLKNDIEPLIIELMKVECGSGNDEPEDWVGALDLALHNISWRDGSKRAIVWIADANAHGKPFCGYDNHNEEAPKMEPLVQEMAEMGIHFVGINVVRKTDRGCEKTLQKLKDLYAKYRGRSFLIEEFERPQNDYLDDDVWPENAMVNFMQTLNKSIRRIGSLFDDTAV